MLQDAVRDRIARKVVGGVVPPAVATGLDEAQRASRGFTVICGQHASQDGRGFLLHLFGGNLFDFELTPQQVAALQVKPGNIECRVGFDPRRWIPLAHPAISLEGVEFDQTEGIDNGGQVSGCAAYQITRPSPGRHALYVTWQFPIIAEFTHGIAIDPFPPSGVIRFIVPNLARNHPVALAYHGPLVLSFRIVHVPDPRQPSLHETRSNPIAKLVDVAGASAIVRRMARA
jgi:hypothetical protein